MRMETVRRRKEASLKCWNKVISNNCVDWMTAKRQGCLSPAIVSWKRGRQLCQLWLWEEQEKARRSQEGILLLFKAIFGWHMCLERECLGNNKSSEETLIPRTLVFQYKFQDMWFYFVFRASLVFPREQEEENKYPCLPFFSGESREATKRLCSRKLLSRNERSDLLLLWDKGINNIFLTQKQTTETSCREETVEHPHPHPGK